MLVRHLLPSNPGQKNKANDASPPEALKLAAQLEAYFLGQRVEFSHADLPINWQSFSEFEQKVAEALIGVAYGETTSYAGLALAAGHPRACRAVGNFMSKNPFPLLLPCHRVIRSDGRPGGFSAGDEWKQRLLQLEGINLKPGGRSLLGT